MSDFGLFTPITFSNGGAPAINETTKNADQQLLALIDEELRRRQAIKLSDYLQYFQSRNTKEIVTIYQYTDWTAYAGTTLSNDTTNNPSNEASVKMLEPDNTASWLGMYQAISKDLTLFENGVDVSSTSDIIILLFYITDITKFTYFDLKLGQDNSNNYEIAYNPASFRNGWNCIFAQKSSFTSNGTPPGWNNITEIRIEALTANNAQNEYISIQLCYMYRQDPVYSGYLNPFQIYQGSVTGWENIFDISLDVIGLYRDSMLDRLCIMKLDQYSIASSIKALHLYCEVLSFISKFEFYCKENAKGACVTWYVDASNYITVYVASSTLYIYAYESASGTTTSKAFANALLKNERYLLYFEKNNNTIRAIIHKGNEAVIVAEYETSISSSSAGCIYLGHYGTTGFAAMTDCVISQTQGHQLEYKKGPFIVKKRYDQTVYNSNVLVNDTELFVDLEGPGIYQIDVFLSVISTSAAPDVKIAWDLSNGYMVRHGLGPASGTTDVYTANMSSSLWAEGTEIPYGVDGTVNQTIIKESFLVEMGNIGGRLQMKWAQNTATTVNTKVEGRVSGGWSYMLVTPVVNKR